MGRLGLVTSEVLEKPKCQISPLNVMGIRAQCHANISKQTTLLDDVDVNPAHEGIMTSPMLRFI